MSTLLSCGVWSTAGGHHHDHGWHLYSPQVGLSHAEHAKLSVSSPSLTACGLAWPLVQQCQGTVPVYACACSPQACHHAAALYTSCSQESHIVEYGFNTNLLDLLNMLSSMECMMRQQAGPQPGACWLTGA